MHGQQSCSIAAKYLKHSRSMGTSAPILTSSLLADGESLVDIVDASDFQVVGARGGVSQSQESEQQNEDLNHW